MDNITKTNCYGCELQKHLYNTWTQVAFLRGQDLSNKLNFYQYTDIKTISGFNIYRLKQIDSDGKFHYLEKIKIYLQKKIVSKIILKKD